MCRGSRGLALLVPMKILPPATTGVECVCDPSSTTHFTFRFVSGSKLSGSPVPVEVPCLTPLRLITCHTIVRKQERPEAKSEISYQGKGFFGASLAGQGLPHITGGPNR